MKSNVTAEKGNLEGRKQEKILDKYKIIKEVGRGISGVVYQAMEKSSARTMRAIKRVEKKGGIKKQDLMNELTILVELDHPDIIRLYDWFEDDNYLYFITDFCQGGEFFDYLEKKSYLSEDEARLIFSQMLGTIKYCHSKKIAHRDLKPQNFLLLKKPQGKEIINLKLIDFGLAIKWQKSLQKELIAKGKRKIVGTAYYISPEVIKGVYDQKCDIWSIGVILYILVTGVPPFDGETDKQILTNIQKNIINFAIPEMKNVSLLLKDLLKKMLKPSAQRISIQNIYQHPWMNVKVNKSPISIDFKTIANFSKFSKMKALAATYLATQMAAIETENFAKLFKTLDQNGDGYLSIEELNQYLTNNKKTLNEMTINQLQNLLHLINTRNGKINYTQFLASTISEQALSEKENLKKVFGMFDKDGNGYIDRDQILQVIHKHGKQNKEIALQQVNEIFLTTDTNSDGKIDFHQFASVMCKVAQ